eukprot:9866600-Alexandrium_andersonii.AAC.1
MPAHPVCNVTEGEVGRRGADVSPTPAGIPLCGFGPGAGRRQIRSIRLPRPPLKGPCTGPRAQG